MLNVNIKVVERVLLFFLVLLGSQCGRVGLFKSAAVREVTLCDLTHLMRGLSGTSSA